MYIFIIAIVGFLHKNASVPSFLTSISLIIVVVNATNKIMKKTYTINKYQHTQKNPIKAGF